VIDPNRCRQRRHDKKVGPWVVFHDATCLESINKKSGWVVWFVLSTKKSGSKNNVESVRVKFVILQSNSGVRYANVCPRLDPHVDPPLNHHSYTIAIPREFQFFKTCLVSSSYLFLDHTTSFMLIVRHTRFNFRNGILGFNRLCSMEQNDLQT
jgi:hypothetical protein